MVSVKDLIFDSCFILGVLSSLAVPRPFKHLTHEFVVGLRVNELLNSPVNLVLSEGLTCIESDLAEGLLFNNGTFAHDRSEVQVGWKMFVKREGWHSCVNF